MYQDFIKILNDLLSYYIDSEEEGGHLNVVFVKVGGRHDGVFYARFSVLLY